MLFSDEFAVLYLQCRIVVLLILLASLLSFSFESLCMKGQVQVTFFCWFIYLEMCTTTKIFGQMTCTEQLVTPKIDVLGWSSC